VMVAMPDLPASKLDQATSTELPTGEIRPRPVTTTRRRPFDAGTVIPRLGN
jgi:hypothetical protein